MRGANSAVKASANAAIELALGSYPGFHVTAPPGDASPYGVFTAAHVDAALVPHVAVLPDGTRVDIARSSESLALQEVSQPPLPARSPDGPTRAMPLGLFAGTRSGDKGADANVGVWAPTDELWAWLANLLTVEHFQQLLPETAPLRVTRHVLPNSMTPVVTFLPFRMSGAILALTSLDFLGLGVPPGTPSLGELLAQGKNSIDAWWISLSTFGVLVVTLLLLTFMGDALRDALDPRKADK